MARFDGRRSRRSGKKTLRERTEESEEDRGLRKGQRKVRGGQEEKSEETGRTARG